MKILMLLDNNFVNDRRVYRTASELAKNNYKVILLCNKENGLLDEELIDGIKLIRKFDTEFYEFKKRKDVKKVASQIINEVEFDIIHAHDQYMLNLGVAIKNKTGKPLIYDSHELYKHFPINVVKKENAIKHFLFLVKYKIVLRSYKKRERENASYIDELITVGESIASILKKHFNFKKEVFVVRNTPIKEQFNSQKNYFHDFFDIPKTKKILIYIAGCLYIDIQNLEQFLKELKDQENIAIVLVTGDEVRKQQFIEKNAAIIGENVYFHELFHPNEISDYISSADIGVLPLWNKKDLSYWYALPNKLFEYMHAELPILAAAQPEIKAVVNKHHCGVAVNCDENNAFFNGTKELLANYDLCKKNAIKAVDQNCWQQEKEQLLKLYRKYTK